ncbi:MAG: MEDS domain-containing protein [Nitrospirae bacterium]|nr:MEDS domain-containing protein [Nitrospirota bacterium]MBF0615828.1 MEDS domain-containing protein [Nitrospirota bacterium]
MEKLNYNVDYGFTPESFPMGTHICFIYSSSEARRKVMSKFVESGLSAKEKFIYLADVATDADIDGYFEQLGLDVLKYRQSGQLFVEPARKGYCPDGRFDVERMLNTLRSYYKKADEEGYTGLRGTGEPVWIKEGVPGVENWFMYESLINKLLVEYPFSGVICQYDANIYDGATLFDVLNVHPLMIVQGQILRNPYYVQPDEFMATHFD